MEVVVGGLSEEATGVLKPEERTGLGVGVGGQNHTQNCRTNTSPTGGLLGGGILEAVLQKMDNPEG